MAGPAGPWRTVNQLELGTAAWVEWWNQRRIHGWCGHVPPAEFEAAFYASRAAGQVAS